MAQAISAISNDGRVHPAAEDSDLDSQLWDDVQQPIKRAASHWMLESSTAHVVGFDTITANVYIVHCLASFLDLRTGAMAFSTTRRLRERLMNGMPHWWHMQYRVFVKGQRFGTAPITEPGVQRQELEKALRAIDKQHGAGSEDGGDPMRQMQRELLRANTQHFHELRAQRAMAQLLQTPVRLHRGNGAAASGAGATASHHPDAKVSSTRASSGSAEAEFDELVDKPRPFLSTASRRLRNMNMLQVYRTLSKFVDAEGGADSGSGSDSGEEGGPEAAATANPTATASAGPGRCIASSATMGPAELREQLEAHVRKTRAPVNSGRRLLAALPQLRQELRDGQRARECYDVCVVGGMDFAVPASIVWALLTAPAALQATLDADFGSTDQWWVPAVPFLCMSAAACAIFMHGVWCMLHDPLWLAGGHSLLSLRKGELQSVFDESAPVPDTVADLDLPAALTNDYQATMGIVVALLLGVRKEGATWAPYEEHAWRNARRGSTLRRLCDLRCHAPHWTSSARWYRWSAVGHDVAGALMHTSCTQLAADQVSHPADVNGQAPEAALQRHARSSVAGKSRSATFSLMLVSAVSSGCMFLSAFLLTLRLTGTAELSHMRVVAPLLLAFSGTVDIPCCRARIGALSLLGSVYGSAAYKNYEGICLPGICGLGILPLFVYVAMVLLAIGLGETLPASSDFYSNASIFLFVGGLLPGAPTLLSTALLSLKYVAKTIKTLVCCCPELRNGDEINFWDADDFAVVRGQWRAQVIWRLIHLQALAVMVFMAMVTLSTSISGDTSTEAGTPLHFLFDLCQVIALWVALGAVVEALMRCRRSAVLVDVDREGAFAKPGALCGSPRLHGYVQRCPCSCAALCGARGGELGLSAVDKDMLVLDAYERWLGEELERLRPNFDVG